tara:strand:+ start:8054 stop:8365 length:312 start_codon:yes stop_codon:yes gene_type:complete
VKQLFYAVLDDPGDLIEDVSSQLFLKVEDAEDQLKKKGFGSVVCFFAQLGDPYELVRIPRWHGYGDPQLPVYFCKCPHTINYSPAYCEECERTAGRFNPDQEV